MRTLEELSAAWDIVITQQESRNWDLGDIALEVETSYGDGTLQEFAHAKDMPYAAVKEYRWVASRYEKVVRTTFSWSVHKIFASLEDRVEAMRSRETWTAAEAREYVGKRKSVVGEIRPLISSVITTLGQVDRLLVDYPPNEVQSRELAAELKQVVEMAWQTYGRLTTGNVDVELARLLGGVS